MFNLPDQFFEDEVREGFYIPACVKQAWGAELSVLRAIDEVCAKHGIHYYADWGTYLGAIRHGGFIPWDDDMDIGMLRSDYEAFLKVRDELPDGFAVYNLRLKEGHDQFLANVVNTTRICFSPEHLTKYHGFPYIACVDIFIIDNVSDDAEAAKNIEDRARKVISLSDGLRAGTFKDNEIGRFLEQVECENNVKIPPNLKGLELAQYLDCLVEEIVSTFKNDVTKKVVQMIPWGLNHVKTQEASWYKKFMYLPFENINVPVPCDYVKAMQARYGDFMKVIKNAGAHNYPYFEGQKDSLLKIEGVELPEYTFNPKMLEVIEKTKKEKGAETENVVMSETDITSEANAMQETYQSTVFECLDAMLEIWSICKNSTDELLDGLNNLQNLAIDLGTYMESVKGEGYDIVSYLEQLCEKIYLLYDDADTYEERIDRADGDDINYKIATGMSDVDSLLHRIEKKIRNRKEYIFLPFKASYFEAFKSEYIKAISDENVDVLVVPIPYYYKNYDGSLRNMQYELDEYQPMINDVIFVGKSDLNINVNDVPDGANEKMKNVIVHCDNYDFKLRRPDRIYIQYPYDNENPITAIPPFLYAENLRKYTDELVYIPWFKTCEFDSSNPRDYKNMKYYCLMPGVVYSNRVLVQSKIIRDNYIDKLTEWAGDDTRTVWEKKIYIEDSYIEPGLVGCAMKSLDGKESATTNMHTEVLAGRQECKNSEGQNLNDCIGVSRKEECKKEECKKEECKKTMLFNIEAGSLSINDIGVINKIERVLDIFAENGDKINVAWLMEEATYSQLAKVNPEMHAKLMGLVAKYDVTSGCTSKSDCDMASDCDAKSDCNAKTVMMSGSQETSTGWLKVLKNLPVGDEFVQIADMFDAYYGDPGKVAHFMSEAKKPVMIMNYEI